MTRHLVIAAAVSLFTFGATPHASAQPPTPSEDPPPPPAAAKTAPERAPAASRTMVTALMLDITISRYQGDKRLSSVPFTMAVTSERQRSTLRVGGDVPVPTMSVPSPRDADATLKPTGFTYRSIGTNIDATAMEAGGGRYRVDLLIEESSVYPSSDAAKEGIMAGAPAFRSLRAQNTLMLKDGQSLEFTAASDRISGEVARISVKLTVVP